MALNSHHTFEELGKTKCSIVEKNCSTERTTFLKQLLEHNNFTVIVIENLLPKTAAKPTVAGAEPLVETPSSSPATYTVGVTDLSFNPKNAVFNRELRTNDEKIVTPNYWKQLDSISKEDSWYWKESPG